MTINLIDLIEGKTWEAELRESFRHEDASIGHALFDADDYPFAVPVVVYDDGSIFCSSDWSVESDLEDIDDVSRPGHISWLDNATGQPAIIFDGLPKALK